MDMHASPPSGVPPGSNTRRDGDDPRPHPSLETLAAFLDGRLPDDQRSEVEVHLADCEDCLDIVGGTAAFLEEEAERASAEAPSPVFPHRAATQTSDAGTSEPETRAVVLRPRPFIQRRWILATGGALAAAALLVVAFRGGFGPGVPTSTGSLATATQPVGVGELFDALTRRPATARLAGLPYRPARGVRRSAAPAPDVPLDVRAAAAKIEEAGAGSTEVDALWARGLAQLATGDAGEAIRSLESAAAARPESAVDIDLSAAWLAQAERTGDAEAARRALETADRVLARDPASLAALFNRALALEYLDRQDDARQAWNAYLARDASSPWADEIRQRIAP